MKKIKIILIGSLILIIGFIIWKLYHPIQEGTIVEIVVDRYNNGNFKEVNYYEKVFEKGIYNEFLIMNRRFYKNGQIKSEKYPSGQVTLYYENGEKKEPEIGTAYVIKKSDSAEENSYNKTDIIELRQSVSSTKESFETPTIEQLKRAKLYINNKWAADNFCKQYWIDFLKTNPNILDEIKK